MQNFRALGALLSDLRASGGWRLSPQSLAAGGLAPRPPKQPPPLRISSYVPECDISICADYIQIHCKNVFIWI